MAQQAKAGISQGPPECIRPDGSVSERAGSEHQYRGSEHQYARQCGGQPCQRSSHLEEKEKIQEVKQRFTNDVITLEEYVFFCIIM